MINKKHQIISLILLALFTIQCSPEKQQDDSNSSNEKVEIPEARLIQTDEIHSFKESLKSIYTVEEMKPNRWQLKNLGEKSSENFIFKLVAKELHNNKNSYFFDRRQRIKVYIYNYPTSEIANEVTSALFKDFPFDCGPIKEGSKKGCKTTPTIYIFDTQYIAMMRISCEDTNEQWEQIMKDFLSQFRTKNSKVIEAKCGKIQWVD